MSGSSLSLDSFSGILFPSAFFRTNRSLSRADLSIYFIWFCLRSRGLMTAKKLDATLCLALLKISKSFLAITSSFSNSFIRLFRTCTAVLYWFLDSWQVAGRNGCRDTILSYMSVLCDLVNDKRTRSWRAFLQWCRILQSPRFRITEPSVLVTFNASSKKNTSSNPFEAPSVTFT